jgi:hypothetical protein
LKRLNWFLPLDDLLAQQQLMSTMLQPFQEEMQRLAKGPADIIDHAILGWRLFHHVIRGYQERHPRWLFTRHEDLSLRPLEEFARVFEHLELDFSPAVRQAIEQHTGQENPPEAGGAVHQLKRNSKANIWNWQHRLTPREIARIREGTKELAGHFYGDGNWWIAQSQCAA